MGLVTLSLSDEDFGKLVSGKTQAQRLFMSGKLKVKGDVMKVGYLESNATKDSFLTNNMAGYQDGTRLEESSDEGKVVNDRTHTEMVGPRQNDIP